MSTSFRRVATARLPTRFGEFRCYAYESGADNEVHLALALGEWDQHASVLVRLHSECLTGEVFGSLRCDCGEQLEAAMAQIAREGAGVVVYLRGHEGRGIGIVQKLRAYGLQDGGLDTVDANVALGLPVDSRDYGVGARMLLDLGVRKVRLLTNNPAKWLGLEASGISVTSRVPLQIQPTGESAGYLAAKRSRLGHLLEDVPSLSFGPHRRETGDRRSSRFVETPSAASASRRAICPSTEDGCAR
jgi:3,4-dihydroxy 2-butanone 4-phosphate synthase/GTP cyclohydrolase II